MPFDTTYHLFTADSDLTILMTVPGGKDTEIYLKRYDNPPARSNAVTTYSIKQFPVIPTEYEKKVHFYASGPVVLGSWILFVGVIVFFGLRKERIRTKGIFAEIPDIENESNGAPEKPEYLTYYGDQLNFTFEQYTGALTKHFPYYNKLSIDDKAIFLHRLENFIKTKTFLIHDDNGFREMPILISAAAIQLTFGLKKYLLPNFEFIHVFPQEFLRAEPVLCFLEGNVSGHCINLSWKHFLDGINENTDGINVGIHEMSHALYYQNFICKEDVDQIFKSNYSLFTDIGTKVFEQQKSVHNGIYSSYAFTNMQEFWAESAEIYFEKGQEFQERFPGLYDAIDKILNQSTLNDISSQS